MTEPAAQLGPSAGLDWWQTGVVYQIYPRSFADANGDGIGDLAGITEHLDHLAGKPDSLGVDAIWLSPFYPSPDHDFGYDISDYLGVDPKYGSLDDFERLVDACHRRGLKVVIDLVLNHSSSDHPWFQASRASRSGLYADWYIWRDAPGRTLTGRQRPPNNWRSWFGGSAWTWEEPRGQFYHHTFLPQQPDLNWRNPAVREALLGVVQTWLDRGVDGFRMDVFNVFFKDAQLRSNPRRIGRRGAWSWQRHLHDRNQPELHDVLRDLRSIVDTRPGRMTVGELFDGMLADAAQLIAPRHLVFDFTLIGLPWSAASFARTLAARDAVFGPERWPANVLSNHDQPRHASRFTPPGRVHAGLTVADGRAKVAAAMLLTLRGTPFLYYGEEIGLRDVEVPYDEIIDPPARRVEKEFVWWNRDGCRSPMPWDATPGHGFTTGRPWIRFGDDAATRNVAAQAPDLDSVLGAYRRLITLRHGRASLRRGLLRRLDLPGDDVLAYVREADGEVTLVVADFSEGGTLVELAGAGAGPWRAIGGSHREPSAPDAGGSLSLRGLEVVVLAQD